MKKALVLLAVLLGIGSSAHAEDNSFFEFYAQSYSFPTKVHFVLTDPLGRRLGRNPLAGQKFDEIPGAEGGYGTDSIGDDVTGETGNERAGCTVRPVLLGTYTFTLYAVANTSFTIGMLAKNAAGKDVGAAPRELIDGFLMAGAARQFLLPYDPASVVPIPVVKQVSFQTLRQDLQTAFQLGQIGDAKFVATLDEALAQGEKALSKDKRKEAVEKLREFVRKLEKAFKGEKDDDRDENDKDDDKDHDKNHEEKEHEKPTKRFVSELAFKSLKDDAEVLIGTLGSKPGKGRGDD